MSVNFVGTLLSLFPVDIVYTVLYSLERFAITCVTPCLQT